MQNEPIKIKVEEEQDFEEKNNSSEFLEWQIEEPNFTPKTTRWFWALGIFAAAVVIFSILLKDYLMIIIVALVIFIIYSRKNKISELINFQLDQDGLHIGNKFYPYSNFESFWIFPAHYNLETGSTNLKEREFVLRYNRHLMPFLSVPFDSKDESEIRKILSKHLEEREEQESIIDLLRKRFF